MKAPRPTRYFWNETSSMTATPWFDKTLRRIAFACGLLALIVAALPSIPEMTTAPSPADASSVPPVKAEFERREQERESALPKIESEKKRDDVGLFVPSFDREEILSDPQGRIADAFLVPPGLQNRVAFWFDIYSRYDSNKRVIHHSLYPWIIFKVVDVEPIINSDKPKFRWMRNQKADTIVQAEMDKVRKALKTLAAKKRKSQLEDDRLSSEEIMARDALAQLGGDVRRQAKLAREKIRVQTGQRNFFAEGLRTAPRYMKVMEEIFVENKLPLELTRLPLVESSFNKHAQSKVGAAGIWQFMESTGKRTRLVVNDLVDERKSPFKATEAAAKLLKENYMILGRSWELAVTAWNHGPGGVKKASRASGTRELSRIIEIYDSRSFSFASENFYSEFLAALYTERYTDRIFPGLPRENPLRIEEVRITRKVKLDQILNAASISFEDFVSINPDLEKLILLNRKLKRPFYKGLRIHVPREAKSAVEYLLAGEKDSRLIGAND